MNRLWHPANPDVWQGRDDRCEAPDALRLFQTVISGEDCPPLSTGRCITLLDFECDVGVRRNRGRPGAQLGPDALRRALANMASHYGHDRLVDGGNIRVEDDDLEAAQQALSQTVMACQRAGRRTLVLGGGHETAIGHGLGLLEAWPQQRLAIVNLDAHLDLRATSQASSGTPFYQLARYCQHRSRAFSYTCYGASRAANTAALWRQASELGATVIDDLSLLDPVCQAVWSDLDRVIRDHDKIYLTIDLDVLPAAEMPAVSAPAALGIPLALILRLVTPLCHSEKLQAVDLVEFNPHYDRDGQGARSAARLLWHILHHWR